MAAKRTGGSTTRVKVDGHEVVTYSHGRGKEVLFLLNGGPGLPSAYLREPLLRMVDKGYRVVTYDQLGCGASDRPTDPKLWRIARYVEEVETVVKALGLDRFHLLGHSWGGWLGIDYALKYGRRLKSFVISNSCGDMPHLIGELNRLRASLGPETEAMMLRHEAAGTIAHPAYQAAITILNYRHVCRLDKWPKPLAESVADWNMGPYGAMQGPHEFLYVGNLKDWNRIPDMHRIEAPCLILVGEHDELPASCASRMQLALPDAELVVFRDCSHCSMYEDPAAYIAAVTKFLDKHRDGPRRGR